MAWDFLAPPPPPPLSRKRTYVRKTKQTVEPVPNTTPGPSKTVNIDGGFTTRLNNKCINQTSLNVTVRADPIIDYSSIPSTSAVVVNDGDLGDDAWQTMDGIRALGCFSDEELVLLESIGGPENIDLSHPSFKLLFGETLDRHGLSVDPFVNILPGLPANSDRYFSNLLEELTQDCFKRMEQNFISETAPKSIPQLKCLTAADLECLMELNSPEPQAGTSGVSAASSGQDFNKPSSCNFDHEHCFNDLLGKHDNNKKEASEIGKYICSPKSEQTSPAAEVSTSPEQEALETIPSPTATKEIEEKLSSPVELKPNVNVSQAPEPENKAMPGLKKNSAQAPEPRSEVKRRMIFEMCLNDGPPMISLGTIRLLKRICQEELFLYKGLDRKLTGLVLTPEESKVPDADLNLLKLDSPGLSSLLEMPMGYYLRRPSTAPNGVSEEQKTDLLRKLSFRDHVMASDHPLEVKGDEPRTGVEGSGLDRDDMKLVFFRKTLNGLELPEEFRSSTIKTRAPKSVSGLAPTTAGQSDAPHLCRVEDLLGLDLKLNSPLTPFNHN